MTDQTDSETEAWRNLWKKHDAWTAAEFAMLCCGWNPSLRAHPVQEQYNDALELITRAVRVSVLPVFELRWPGTIAEQMYAAAPLFNPKMVVPWAAKHFPKFPFRPEDFEVVGDSLDQRERTTLLVIIAVLASMAKVDISHHAKAAGVIESESRTLGAPVAKRTIEHHLSRVSDALERRQ